MTSKLRFSGSGSMPGACLNVTCLLCGAIVVGGWLSPYAVAQPPSPRSQRPCELGGVDWQRDLEAAQSESRRTQRPLFVLFQEVPGCETCQKFGHQPLSQPLLVEAIETLFIPVLVYNNRQEDAALLARFKEPSWNNPVVRYLDASGADLLPRKDRVWSVAETANRMVAALEAAEVDVPKYLRLITREAQAPRLETATFAMHCFWEGEAKLGAIEGVFATQSAFLDGKEVVQLDFDPQAVEYAQLVRSARQLKCAAEVYPSSESQRNTLRQLEIANIGPTINPDAVRVAPASDQQYYLNHSSMQFLPLTPLQSVRINSALGLKQDPHEWLSPRQAALAKTLDGLSPQQLSRLAAWERPSELSKLPAYQHRLAELLDGSH